MFSITKKKKSYFPCSLELSSRILEVDKLKCAVDNEHQAMEACGIVESSNRRNIGNTLKQILLISVSRRVQACFAKPQLLKQSSDTQEYFSTLLYFKLQEIRISTTLSLQYFQSFAFT